MNQPYESYKPSGIDWLGNIPSHWEVKKLKYFVSLNKWEELDELTGFKIALENIEGYTGRLIPADNTQFDGIGNPFKDGDVLFNKLRPYLSKAYLAKSEGMALGELLVLTPDRNQITSEFLFYRVLSSSFIEIVNGSTYGAKMPRANWDFIGNVILPTPPLAEQRAIAEYLDRKTAQIDDLITRKEQLLALLQQKRQAIINEAVTRGLDANAPTKDSGIDWLGEIPAHWETSKVKYEIMAGYLEIQDGNHGEIHPKADDYVEEGIPFVMANNINYGELDTRACKFLSKSLTDKLRIGFSVEGDVLLTHKGTIGRIALVEKIDSPYIMLTPQVTYYRVMDNSLFNRFLMYFFESDIFQNQLKIGSADGSTRNYIGLLDQKDMFILKPPRCEQDQIVQLIESKVSSIRKAINQVRAQLAYFKTYRQSLISEVVTGKVDVRAKATAGV